MTRQPPTGRILQRRLGQACRLAGRELAGRLTSRAQLRAYAACCVLMLACALVMWPSGAFVPSDVPPRVYPGILGVQAALAAYLAVLSGSNRSSSWRRVTTHDPAPAGAGGLTEAVAVCAAQMFGCVLGGPFVVVCALLGGLAPGDIVTCYAAIAAYTFAWASLGRLARETVRSQALLGLTVQAGVIAAFVGTTSAGLLLLPGSPLGGTLVLMANPVFPVLATFRVLPFAAAGMGGGGAAAEALGHVPWPAVSALVALAVGVGAQVVLQGPVNRSR